MASPLLLLSGFLFYISAEDILPVWIIWVRFQRIFHLAKEKIVEIFEAYLMYLSVKL